MVEGLDVLAFGRTRVSRLVALVGLSPHLGGRVVAQQSVAHGTVQCGTQHGAEGPHRRG